MRFLFAVGALVFGLNSFAESTFLTNVSLKVSAGQVSPQTSCFLDESFKQAIPEYNLTLITHSTIDISARPEDEGRNASVHFIATHKGDGSRRQFAITLTAFDDNSKWSYVQTENSVFPVSKKVSSLATVGAKGANQAPLYILLDACK
jgi:hypothetical protein